MIFPVTAGPFPSARCASDRSTSSIDVTHRSSRSQSRCFRFIFESVDSAGEPPRLTVSLSLSCFTQLYHSLRTVSNDVPEIEGAYQVRPSAMLRSAGTRIWPLVIALAWSVYTGELSTTLLLR